MKEGDERWEKEGKWRRQHYREGNQRRVVGCRLKKEGEQGGEKGTEEKIKGDAV